MLIQRVTSGGWALSYAGGKQQTVKKYRVQITSYAGINVLPGERYLCSGFTEEHGGAVLQFSKLKSNPTPPLHQGPGVPGLL